MHKNWIITALLCVPSFSCSAAETAQKKDKCLVLLTNDDGIQSQNLLVLAAELAPDVDLVISAPSTNHSGASSSLGNWREPLQIGEAPTTGATHAWTVTGGPVLAARFGLWRIRQIYDRAPDLVVSGPNSGLNWGNAARYSGTVGAAREGAGQDIPSLAISITRSRTKEPSVPAIELAAKLVRQMCVHKPEPVLLNLNIPAIPSTELADIVIAKPDMQIVQMKFNKNPEDGSYQTILSYGETAQKGRDVQSIKTGIAVITILPMIDQPRSDQSEAVAKLLK